MFIFALLSIPLFLIIIDKLCYKSVIIFAFGIVVSQFLSILMWALGTFYNYDTDIIFTKSIKVLIIHAVPLILLFGYLCYMSLSTKKLKRIPNIFIYGFLYWNMLFFLINDIRVTSNLKILYMPLMYLSIVYIFYFMDNISYHINNRLVKGFVLGIIPFYIFLYQVLSSFSNIIAISCLVISAVLLLLLKFHIGNSKSTVLTK